jgi:hypothetical protein
MNIPSDKELEFQKELLTVFGSVTSIYEVPHSDEQEVEFRAKVGIDTPEEYSPCGDFGGIDFDVTKYTNTSDPIFENKSYYYIHVSRGQVGQSESSLKEATEESIKGIRELADELTKLADKLERHLANKFPPN